MAEVSYIEWQSSYHFVQKVQLGAEERYYNLAADYNTRDDSWYVSIYTYEDELILSYKKLVLNVDILKLCYHSKKPTCQLIALADSDFVQRITEEAMMIEDVRLYHVV